MKGRVRWALLGLGSVASLLACGALAAGLWSLSAGALPEADLALGLGGGLTLLLLWGAWFERRRGRSGFERSSAKSASLPRGPEPTRAEAPRPAKLHERALGLLATLASLLLLGAGAQLLYELVVHPRGPSLEEGEPHESESAAAANPARVVGHLRRIAAAQERYRQRDWDGDGARTYSRFFVHLWRSVDPKGRPVPVGLLPQRLAWSMAASRALDGYYFMDLHDQARSADPADPKPRPLDPAREWALVALPVAEGPDAPPMMLTTQEGSIWARRSEGEIPWVIPVDLRGAGWRLLARGPSPPEAKASGSSRVDPPQRRVWNSPEASSAAGAGQR